MKTYYFIEKLHNAVGYVFLCEDGTYTQDFHAAKLYTSYEEAKKDFDFLVECKVDLPSIWKIEQIMAVVSGDSHCS